MLVAVFTDPTIRKPLPLDDKTPPLTVIVELTRLPAIYTRCAPPDAYMFVLTIVMLDDERLPAMLIECVDGPLSWQPLM